jgi:hypothetical protein
VNLKYKYENNSKVLELQSLNTKTNKGVIVAMVAKKLKMYVYKLNMRDKI